ncbi:MAG: M1 family aminopeptidase [Deltaproteobacteria bacterium]|nr:M1 family aminopeptidase [Deltaproteobacteria bacterium]
MWKRMTLALILGLLMSVPVFSQPSGGGSKTQYEEVYRQLKELKAGPRGAQVKDLVLKRDVATITLSKGQLFLCQPIDGFGCAAVFKGKGNIVFVPPVKIEREQIARFYQSDSINRDFSEMFLIFADGTLEEFNGKLKYETTAKPEEFGSVIDEAVNYLTYNYGLNGDYCDPEIMKTILEKRPNGLFYAHLKGPGYQTPEMFEINPYTSEEVKFYKNAKEGGLVGYHRDLISQFHWQADSQETETGKIREPLSILSYKMDCRLSGEKRMDVSCRMETKSLIENSQWIYFDIASKWCAGVEVDSVFWQGAGQAEYYKGKELYKLWVKAPKPMGRGQLCTLTVFYHGDFMDRTGNWIYLTSSIGWYPQAQTRNKSGFDVTYHCPSKFDLVSVGDMASTEEKGDIRTTRCVSKKPVRNFTFNVGFFDKYKINDDRIPPVTILSTEMGQSDLQKVNQVLNRFSYHVSGISGKNMKKQIGSDVANSMAFFQETYGTCPIDNFYALECFTSGGEAFPGLINLSLFTYYNSGTDGSDEMLRAHEVAHQWWAFGVDYRTYHDRWLSEGLAEFSGLWYMQTALKDNTKYFKWFEDYRDDILNNRKFLLGSGKQAGPVWLGTRNWTSETEGDYGIIVYQKGAWVIHMLRNMMIDLNTMKEGKFTGMMRDYYSTYRDSLVTTEQFRKVVEKHNGMDMGWFFDQWVYGTEIPSYKYCYSARQTPEGKYRVTLKVRQEGVSPDFMMYVPLLVDFGENRQARLRVLIKGPLTELELPLMPLPPKNIELNPYQSVLCQQNREDF